jgi:hypothetical protein
MQWTVILYSQKTQSLHTFFITEKYFLVANKLSFFRLVSFSGYKLFLKRYVCEHVKENKGILMNWIALDKKTFLSHFCICETIQI